MSKILSLVSLLLMAAVALAADINGRWKGQFQGGDGSREITFQFKTDGAKLSGTVAGMGEKVRDIVEGKVAGDDVTFAINSEWQGNPVKLLYKGKVAGEEIRFTLQSEDGGWSTEVVAKRSN